MDAVYVYSRNGCHLCDLLIEQLAPLIEGRLRLEVRDIDANPDWHERFWMDIPVVEYDRKVICRHSLDPAAITGILRR